jgi:hypothetical protein
MESHPTVADTGAVYRALEEHLGTRQVSRVVYGAIIGMAVVVVLEGHPPPAGQVITALVGTAVAVGLAELYSEALGAETRTHRRVTGVQLREFMADVIAVAFGIAFPAVFFVLAAAGAFETETAFTIAKWSGLGLIAFYGFCAARLAGAPVVGSMVRGVGAAMIGGALIAFKALVH